VVGVTPGFGPVARWGEWPSVPEADTGGVLTRTPDGSLPIGPNPRADTGFFFDTLGRVLRLEEALLVSLGGLLLLTGLVSLALAGYLPEEFLAGCWRRTLLGSIALALPLPAMVRAIAWLTTGGTDLTETVGTFPNPGNLPSERLLETSTHLRVIDVGVIGPEWIVLMGERILTQLASSAIIAGVVTIALATLWYWYRPRTRRALELVRNGVAVVTLVVLFSVVLGTMAWLATGDVDHTGSLESEYVGVTTSFESGTMQGWSVREGSASVTTGPGSGNALHVDGVVERSFTPLAIDGEWAIVDVEVSGPARVRTTVEGDEVGVRTVHEEASWRVPSDDNLTVRVAGTGVWLESVRFHPVIGQPNQQAGPTIRGEQ
jgi:hypothetical protein